jgi:hypothetical protein
VVATGSVSVNVRLAASFGPLFVTLITYETLCPRLATEGSQQLPLPPLPNCDLLALSALRQKRCASSTASPPRNSTWQPSILHDHLRQSAQQACSTQVFTLLCPKHQATLQNYFHRHLGTARAHPAHLNTSPLFISIGDHHRPHKHLPNHERAFNIHNPQLRSPRPQRLRLPSPLQIENTSD